MALFKILKGDSSNFVADLSASTVVPPWHNGYCYYVEDNRKLYIDWLDGEKQKRTPLNAEYADKLKGNAIPDLTAEDIISKINEITPEQIGAVSKSGDTISGDLIVTGSITGSTVNGAVWNDYAEYRSADSIEPGRCVVEGENGILHLSTSRLQPGANVISDTFGFSIGETENCKTPIAVAGRALVYTNEERESYPLGAAVCSGPNGTVSLMTREEIREYPERIIGTVSEIPTYEFWGSGNVKVNNRIWVKVR